MEEEDEYKREYNRTANASYSRVYLRYGYIPLASWLLLTNFNSIDGVGRTDTHSTPYRSFTIIF